MFPRQSRRAAVLAAPLLIFALLAQTGPAEAAKKTPAAKPAAAAAAAPAPAAQGPLEDRVGIAATVNDEAVTFTDIRDRMKLYLLGAPGVPPPEVREKIALQVLARLIDERLQMQEAKNLGINVEDAEVDAAFAHVAENNHLTADQFKAKLADAGVRLSTLQDQIRAQVAWNMVVRRKLRPQINISETEIDSELVRRQKDAGKLEYEVAEILLPVTSPQMEDITRHGADQIIEQIKHGARFSVAAKQFSKAPGAAEGGDLGWIQDGQLDPKLMAALAEMQVGTLSAPIRTDKGYEILFLRDKHTGDAPLGAPGAANGDSPAPASAPQTDDILSIKQLVIPTKPHEPETSIKAKETRAASLKNEISSCDGMAAMAKDYSAAGSGDLPKVPLSQQPEDIQDAVRHLPVGTLSQPLRRPAGITVLMVCARETGKPVTAAAAGPKSADQAREDIATQLGSKRLEQLQDRYLKDLRAAAYIEKRF